jgi:hypothetical protein
MSYDNLSSFAQNVLKFYQQFTGEERRVPLLLMNSDEGPPLFLFKSGRMAYEDI